VGSLRSAADSNLRLDMVVLFQLKLRNAELVRPYSHQGPQ
jgi:hypothetical protein